MFLGHASQGAFNDSRREDCEDDEGDQPGHQGNGGSVWVDGRGCRTGDSRIESLLAAGFLIYDSSDKSTGGLLHALNVAVSISESFHQLQAAM
jgi:hypothetical protein